MVGGGFAIGTHEEGREKIEESLVTLHDRLTVERVTQADHGELRRDIGAVDIPPEPGTQPGKEVPHVIHVSMGEEDRVQRLGVNREAFDQIYGLIALPLQKAAIDRETLSTSGVKDEVSRTGDRPAGAERLIEERRGRQLVMGRKTQLHIAGEFGNGIDGLVLIKAKGRDGLRRVEQFGEFVEV
jgi:hypothetical protein